MFTFTTIGLSVSPRRITDSCMGIPSGKSCWPAQSYENRTGRAMSGRRSTPIDAKRLADFLAKIEAYEAVLLQRQRDIENQIVVYHIEQKSAEVANTPQPVLQEMLGKVLNKRLNTPKPELNGQNPRRALLINTRPPDGELFHRTNFYQKGLTLLGKTTFDRHIKVDVATAEHLVEKKRARGKTT